MPYATPVIMSAIPAIVPGIKSLVKGSFTTIAALAHNAMIPDMANQYHPVELRTFKDNPI